MEDIGHMKHTTVRPPWKRQGILVLMLLAGFLLVAGAGCQTCSLSKEDFEKQQRGQTVDKETGEAVATVGTLGYSGVILGEFIAWLVGK